MFMYVCMYVCGRVGVCTYVYFARKHYYKHLCISVQAYIGASPAIYAIMFLRARVCMCVDMHVCVDIHKHVAAKTASIQMLKTIRTCTQE
jgi:hypothetical protein